MTTDRRDRTPGSDTGFAAWLDSLRFTVDPSDREALRAAYDQLARMNELNRVAAGADQ